jgi:pyrophosphatase PpaX
VLAYRERDDIAHDSMVRAYPGVTAALEELASQGFRMGVVTSKSRGIAKRGLECVSLVEFFEIVVACDDVELHKPDPYPLVHAAGLMGVAIDRCAYVGDSPHDMTAARSAGCVSVAALWGVSTRDRMLVQGPDYVVASIAEVALLFDGREADFRVA